MSGENLLGIPETRLADDTEVRDRLAEAGRDALRIKSVIAGHPASSLAWATLADVTFRDDSPVESYAYARVGYHRGLDALRKAGWRGQGPIPWSHPGNRGVLRALFVLRRAAEAIGEQDEVERLGAFLHDADPEVLAILEAESTPTQAIPVVPPTEAIVIRGAD